MYGKNLISFLLILIVNFSFITCLNSDFKVLINITGKYPSTVDLGELNSNDILKIKVLVPGISSANNNKYIELRQGTLTNDTKFVSYIDVTSGNISTQTIIQASNYYIMSRLQYIPRFSLEIKINEKKIDLGNDPNNQYSYYQKNKVNRYFQFLNSCIIMIDPSQFSYQFKNKSGYLVYYSDGSLNLFQNDVIIFNTQKGKYGMHISLDEGVTPFSYSIPIYYKYAQECIFEEVYYCSQDTNIQCRIRNRQTCSLDGTATCLVCGDGKLDPGEDCDGTDHCTSSCKPETGYICYANNTCAIASKCGDGKLDEGEDCDSVPHCISCKAQVGYSCTSNACYNCGNSILQVGQDCDNGNKPGCQSCKVVPLYKCKSALSTSSVCFNCGNSIYELGEECDNGNKTGCRNCTIDRGYKCKSKINAISNCTGVCGDSILTPDQQCDNGNTTGCINCLKDSNYNCTVLPLKASRCYYCGNYIVEIGEQCDNSNKKGCISCKIQPGYNCRTDPRYCYLIKQNCRNGQRQISQQCDDGNKINGDGCSSQCKTETGYICTLALGQKSNCQLVAAQLQGQLGKK